MLVLPVAVAPTTTSSAILSVQYVVAKVVPFMNPFGFGGGDWRAKEALLLRLMIQSLKVAAIIVLTLAILFTGQRALFHYLDAAGASDGQQVTFVVNDSESVSSVADRLEKEGLIRSGTYFKLKMRLSNADSKLKAGRFTLRKGMSVDQVIQALTTCEAVQTVTIRFQEGWRTEQYAEALVQAGFIQTTDQFMTAIKDGTWNYDFLASRPSETSLEGFLFPIPFSSAPTPRRKISSTHCYRTTRRVCQRLNRPKRRRSD